MKKAFIPLLFLTASLFVSASKNAPAKDTQDSVVTMEDLIAKLDTFKYQSSGTVALGKVASMEIPKGFKYLDGPQAAFVLHNVWHNPYSESLGMLFPEDQSPFMDNCWAVAITYEEEGHIKDDDAKDIKYDDLLKQMKDRVKESNPERVKQGGNAMELVGWAEQPSYDAKAHKLYWAKELKYVADTNVFLNYNIRILGRKGVLVLNAIGGVDQLAEIKQQTQPILAATNFTSGNTYGEFNSSVDKVAAYGIMGLIAGGVLVKTGLLAKVGVLLLKFLKPILVGVGAIGTAVLRFFKGRKEGDG